MKKIKGKQESTETLYLKMMGSSTYRKKIKNAIEMVQTYNRIVRNNKMEHADIVEVARSFTDNIKAPTPRAVVKEESEGDILKGSTRL
jgi:chorismate mutase